LHYISDSDAANRPQTRINKGSVLFAILQTVEDGFGVTFAARSRRTTRRRDAQKIAAPNW
ncbi:MAG: hypothetical protein WCE49_18965, partial [Terrimicrobiaceae bacterium]